MPNGLRIFRNVVGAYNGPIAEGIPYRVFESAYLEEGYRSKTAFRVVSEIVENRDYRFDNGRVYLE